MKKKIILILLLAVLIIIVSILLLTINHNNEMKRYEQIKKHVRDEAITYLTITRVPESGKKAYLYEDDIVNPLHRGADKKIILDVDTSYCRVSIEGFEKNSKWDANIYLKCKKYEDKLYEETLLHVLCERGIEKGYEEYYDKYGWFYDSFNCPERIKNEMN